MRIAIAGASGRIGSLAVAALERAGHQPVPVSRSTGADACTGAGLAEALQGASAVIDCLNVPSGDQAETVGFFGPPPAGTFQISGCPAWPVGGRGRPILMAWVGRY